MLIINLFSLIINLDIQIFILGLFCHGGIHETCTKKESMPTSINFILPHPQRLLKITHSCVLLTSISSCSIKSSQNGSIKFSINHSKLILNILSRKFLLRSSSTSMKSQCLMCSSSNFSKLKIHSSIENSSIDEQIVPTYD